MNWKEMERRIRAGHHQTGGLVAVGRYGRHLGGHGGQYCFCPLMLAAIGSGADLIVAAQVGEVYNLNDTNEWLLAQLKEPELSDELLTALVVSFDGAYEVSTADLPDALATFRCAWEEHGLDLGEEDASAPG